MKNIDILRDSIILACNLFKINLLVYILRQSLAKKLMYLLLIHLQNAMKIDKLSWCKENKGILILLNIICIHNLCILFRK